MNQNRTPAGVPTGGQFAEQAKGESDVGLDAQAGYTIAAESPEGGLTVIAQVSHGSINDGPNGGASQAPSLEDLAARPGALDGDELDSLDYAIEALDYKIEEGEDYPGTYDEEEMRELREKQDRLVNRVAYLHALHDSKSPTERFDALAQEHARREQELQAAAVGSLREQVRDQYPTAVYFTIEESDQGPHMAAGRVFDVQGNLLTGTDDQGETDSWGEPGEFEDTAGASSWLPSQYGHWESATVDAGKLRELHGDRSDLSAASAHGWVKVIEVDPGSSGGGMG